MIPGEPITLEVLRDFDFFWKGEILHASRGRLLRVSAPDTDTAAAVEQGFVKEWDMIEGILMNHVPDPAEVHIIDGDMPELAIRPTAKDWDAATMVKRAMETHKDNPPDKAITIFLWDVDAKYDTVFFNSGLSLMQAVALLEKIKHDLLSQMDEQTKDRQEANHGKEDGRTAQA